MPESAPAPTRRIVGRVLRSVVSLLLLVYLLGRIDPRAAGEALLRCSPSLLALAIGLFLLSQALWVARLPVLLRPQGIDLSLLRSAELYLAGCFANNFLPSTVGGDGVKVLRLHREYRRAWVVGGAVVLERVLNTYVRLVFVPVLLLTPAWLPSTPAWIATGAALLLLAGGLGALGWAHGRARRSEPAKGDPLAGEAVPGAAAPGADASWRSRLAARLRELAAALRPWILRPRSLGVALLLSVLLQLINALAFWLLARAVGMRIEFLNLLAVLVVVYFVVLLPISFNGIGLQEVTLVGLLAEAGQPRAEALAFALLIRLFFLVLSLPGGVFLLRTRRAGPSGSHWGGKGEELPRFDDPTVEEDAAERTMKEAERRASPGA